MMLLTPEMMLLTPEMMLLTRIFDMWSNFLWSL
jgi:hypothetical protein